MIHRPADKRTAQRVRMAGVEISRRRNDDTVLQKRLQEV